MQPESALTDQLSCHNLGLQNSTKIWLLKEPVQKIDRKKAQKSHQPQPEQPAQRTQHNHMREFPVSEHPVITIPEPAKATPGPLAVGLFQIKIGRKKTGPKDSSTTKGKNLRF